MKMNYRKMGVMNEAQLEFVLHFIENMLNSLEAEKFS